MSHKISDPKISCSQQKILFVCKGYSIITQNKTPGRNQSCNGLGLNDVPYFFFFSFPATLNIGFHLAFYLMEADGCHTSKYPLYSKQEKRKNNGRRNF